MARRHAAGIAVLIVGIAVLAGSALLLVLTGNADIRYSADHDDTVPMWTRWMPALVGIALVRLVPLSVPDGEPLPAERAPRLKAAVLTASAVLFAVLLWFADQPEPTHTVLKLVLLLGVPAVLFWVLGRGAIPRTPVHRLAPAIPVLAWLLLSYTGPLAAPPSDFGSTVDLTTLLVTMVVVFLINSFLEEVFYRRWLQTRWEFLLGRWPAIVLASLLWAVWHIGIQGNGDLPVDLASAFANQGVTGLFLGYLWSKYRAMWPLLLIHGAINAAPILIGLL
ncbi:CAAX protease self-immunity [Saccharopolyspora antimicrobica]|uniref:CAAX prenyl protease-like protein n=1 Tax=Saccharopolyspora antimicrobica TaxID=455193 RepID=A0A1I4VBQ3_9PSEU|nr:CAAX prenyl protease-like protein [Saccharopolyspora antimicrobica]SFM98642.1 CAAX protease self-immunity [Saccharopolyspora antimicrobica]